MAAPLAPAARVRRFNRFYTRRIGLLTAGHLHSPFSLAEARVLYEVAHLAEPTAGGIATALNLDPGYLSRLLRGLRQRGLLTARAAPSDRRRRRLTLTARGRKTFGALDARATAEVAAMLVGLSRAQERRLLESLDAVEDLLADAGGSADAVPEVTLRTPEAGDLGWVVQRHGELYATEYGWNADFERLVARIIGEYASEEEGPTRRCWIATLGGQRAGCVFLMPASAGIGRLRLLLVEPWARGRGVGGRLVGTCVEASRRAGLRTLTLWTNDLLVEARRLYQRAGFRLVRRERHRSFGKSLVGQNWDLDLQ